MPAAAAAPASQPTNVFTTPLLPQDAAKAVMVVFELYRPYSLDVYNGGPYVTVNQGNRVAAAGDYFGVEVDLQTASGNLHASCHWIKPGQTTVEFTSSGLPPAAEAMVRQQVRDAVDAAAKAATQPAGN